MLLVLRQVVRGSWARPVKRRRS